ncbi:MAG: 2-oxoacid:acceptor oxidoreductase subunit alpha [Endomicrobiales bacterium]
MNDFSFLIGGSAGDGIDAAGVIIGRLFSSIGYYVYIYRDYPSIIRGGHTISIIRVSRKRIATHSLSVDMILALNQETVDVHKHQLKANGCVLYDPDSINIGSLSGRGIKLAQIVKEQAALPITRNTCMIGALCKAVGMPWDVAEPELKNNFPKATEMNLKVARAGFDACEILLTIERNSGATKHPLLTGNEAIGLGLVSAGLEAYAAYPMTPSSAILHFLAQHAEALSLDVIHAESEISVILMALGFAYAGKKAAVGTSGGGFCLMTEGVSLAGMAELPVVVIVGQRPGPSTGLPSYTSQTELHFVLHAGQGEFPRLIVAPGDAEEAYFWSAFALKMAWKYQIPAFVMCDKTLCEGLYNLDFLEAEKPIDENPVLWDHSKTYGRYADSVTGVSPLAFPGEKDTIVKVNSYEHDESGITTEEAAVTKSMMEKRMRKEKYLVDDLEKYAAVKVYGTESSSTAIVCWGSNKPVCVEVAELHGLKVIHPLVLHPFPVKQFRNALKGVTTLISVENNATGQLARLIEQHGFKADREILKYDGRPFTIEELAAEIKNLSGEGK